MKKKFLVAAIVFALFAPVFAQVSVDPTDRFYLEAQGWELKGYIDPLPLIRPYPNTLIKSILQKVIDCGSVKEAELALMEYERIFGKPYSVYVYGAGEYKSSQDQKSKETDGTKNVKGEGGLAGEVVLHPLVSFGYDLGIYAEVTAYDDIAPYYVNKAEDAVFDPVTVGPIESFLDWNANITAGTNQTYMTAGLSKTGYGAFIGDGLALNDTAFHSANIIFNVTRDRWSYGSSYEIIGATSNNPDEYGDHLSGKYLSFHALKFRFNKYIDVSYYENIIFGPNMNLAYLFPVPYMPIQNIGGANDNLQMGLVFDIKPVPGANWSTDIFVDDLAVNDIVKLHLDTKIRVGGQTGIVFSPVNNTCYRLGLNYQMVLPYVYSHWEYKSSDSGYIGGETVNYQNYTNSGVHIGSVLDPNSDKVSFSAHFTPKPFLRFNFNTMFVRHCNSAEAFSDEDAAIYVLSAKDQYITDGSVYMHQMFSDPDEGATSGDHVDQAWNSLGFMTSDHKMGVIQANVNGEFDFRKSKFGTLTLFAGYTFEYVKNKGVTRNLYKGGSVNWSYDKSSDTYTLNGNPSTEEEVYAAAVQVAHQQKAEWVKNLTDKVNHYITLGFRYTY